MGRLTEVHLVIVKCEQSLEIDQKKAAMTQKGGQESVRESIEVV
jgi:hypothetical protein